MALTTSQRITLIKTVCQRLSKESWANLELTLRIFGLTVQDDYNGGTTYEHSISATQTASEETLVALANHLNIEIEPQVVANLEPSFWKAGQFRVFLSHLAAERKWVGDLQTQLAKYGMSSFVAHRDIEPTTEWQSEIEIALKTCEGLVAVLHHNFHDSKITTSMTASGQIKRLVTLWAGIYLSSQYAVGKTPMASSASTKASMG